MSEQKTSPDVNSLACELRSNVADQLFELKVVAHQTKQQIAQLQAQLSQTQHGIKKTEEYLEKIDEALNE